MVSTTFIKRSTKIEMVYHETVVASFNFVTGVVTLNNGGYFTVTTKKRMNQFAEKTNLNFHVYQENYKWFVDLRDKSIPFNGTTVQFTIE